MLKASSLSLFNVRRSLFTSATEFHGDQNPQFPPFFQTEKAAICHRTKTGNINNIFRGVWLSSRPD